MASSISHDLRHSLAAIVANESFFVKAACRPISERNSIRKFAPAVNQMTDLIDSLLEFSVPANLCGRPTATLRTLWYVWCRRYGYIRSFIRWPSQLTCDGSSSGWFDAKKLERALFNLLLNACESVIPESGSINVGLREVHNGVEIRVSDTGRGIPELIQGKLFEPFVSLGQGKWNRARAHGSAKNCPGPRWGRGGGEDLVVRNRLPSAPAAEICPR